MQVPHAVKLICFAWVALTLAACTSLPSGPQAWRAKTDIAYLDEVEVCLDFFRRMDLKAKRAGYVDAERTVPGFPYLRSDRFLASLAGEVEDRDAFDEWVQWLAMTSDTTIVFERDLADDFNSEEYVHCREDLIEADFATAAGRDALRQAVHVPDSYATWKRALGVYPITRLFMAWGFNRWKDEYAERIASPFDNSTGVHYRLASSQSAIPTLTATDAAREINRQRQSSELDIPYMSERLLLQLAYTHAPTFSVASDEPYDRVGTPTLKHQGDGSRRIEIDTSNATASVRFSYTRFQGKVLPQLTYLIWFKERPKEGPFDLIGGDLDGLMWRVTIGLDGKPLVYDTAHACGCYHLFFPVPPTRRKPMPEDEDLREEAFVPFEAPVLSENERLVIRLSSRDHYVVGLDKENRETAIETQEYRIKGPAYFHGEVFGQDAALQAISVDGSEEDFQSIYGKNGLINQSRRLERWLLWPSGIASPGAMRAWGHHATAFVGKRHFDDPFLLEEAFER